MSQAAVFTPFSKPYFDLSAEQNVVSSNTKMKRAEKISFCLGGLTTISATAYIFKATTLAAAGSLPLVALALGSVMLVAGLILHITSPNRSLEKQLYQPENIKDALTIKTFDFETLDLTGILSYLDKNPDKFNVFLNKKDLPATFKDRLYKEYAKIRLPKLHEDLADNNKEIEDLTSRIQSNPDDETLKSEIKTKKAEGRKLISEEKLFVQKLAVLGNSNETLAKEVLQNLKDNHALFLSNITIPTTKRIPGRNRLDYTGFTGSEKLTQLLENFDMIDCQTFFRTLALPMTHYVKKYLYE